MLKLVYHSTITGQPIQPRITSKLVMSNTIKSNTKRLSVISTSQDLQTHLKVVLPPTRVSNRSIESNTSISNPNAKAKDDAMNECDNPVSLRTRAN